MNIISKKKLALLLMLSLICSSLMFGQEKSCNNDIWLHYFGKNKITEKFSFSFEATMRYANGFSEKQQYFVRPSVDYQFTKSFMGSLGLPKRKHKIVFQVRHQKNVSVLRVCFRALKYVEILLQKIDLD